MSEKLATLEKKGGSGGHGQIVEVSFSNFSINYGRTTTVTISGLSEILEISMTAKWNSTQYPKWYLDHATGNSYDKSGAGDITLTTFSGNSFTFKNTSGNANMTATNCKAYGYV